MTSYFRSATSRSGCRLCRVARHLGRDDAVKGFAPLLILGLVFNAHVGKRAVHGRRSPRRCSEIAVACPVAVAFGTWGQNARDTIVATPSAHPPNSLLDRLARSTRDLLNTLNAVAKAGATFGSLRRVTVTAYT